jgi:hypothetical protein
VKLFVLQTRFSDFFDVVRRRPDAVARFHQLLASSDEETRERLLQQIPPLRGFQGNEPLRSFFQQTSTVDEPASGLDPGSRRLLLGIL